MITGGSVQNPEEFPVESPETPPGQEEPQPSPEKKITLLNGISAVFNGMGIGFLLGILWSLSISPVIGGVIATLSSLLALFLGLSEKYLDPLKSLRIGAFGLFAVAGVILGLYLRANDPFAPTLRDKMEQYIELGYSQKEARAFITKAVLADSTKALREASVLYSSTVDASACDDLAYANEQNPDEIINVFKMAGGTWEELAVAFSKDLPKEYVGKSLLLMRDCFCSLTSSGTIEMTNLEKVRKINANDSVDHIESVLSSSGESWNAIVTKVKERIPGDQKHELYL
jgi:hypothetical protein